MTTRILWYVIIAFAFYIGIIPGILANICAYFLVRHFYESFFIALFIDVWYLHAFPYALVILFTCVVVRKIIMPYIRI